MLSQLAEKATFVNYLPRLTQATSDDGEPTAGYLLDEISKMTFQSVSLSHQLVDYLTHRLNKSSTPVKIKVLKIAIHLIHNGHVSFRQQLRHHDGSIKIAVQHSGPSDALLGITLYKDVQKLAQDTLDLLFDPEMMKEEGADGRSMSSIETPPSFMGGMGAVAHSSGKYEGFGNSIKEREGTVTNKMLDYLGRLIHPSDEQTSEVIRAALHSSPGDYQPVAIAGALIDPVFTAECPTPKASFIKNHVPGRAGGGWESDEDDENYEFDNQVEPEAALEIASEVHEIPHKFQLQNDFPASNTLEAQEVLCNFCKIPGLPSIDELDEICAKCAEIGISQILLALPKVSLELTGSDNEIRLMRILLLCEWLYYYDNLVHQALSKNAADVLDQVVKDLDLSAACKSKLTKLKIIFEKSHSAFVNLQAAN